MAYTPVTSLPVLKDPLLTIDGWVAPAPHSIDYSLSDIDSEQTGRTQDAKLHRQRVRADILTIELSWQKITPLQAYNLLQSTKAEEFPVRVFDISKGVNLQNIQMYRGANSTKISISNVDENNLVSNRTLVNLSFTLIQL
jgi:hypothetical protein